jgi:hypothetical protein
MKTSGFTGRTLCVVTSFVAAASLGACSTLAGNGTLPGLAGPGNGAAARSIHRFKYTGHEQTFVVPTGVTSLRIAGFGASGGDSTGGYGSESGGGAGGGSSFAEKSATRVQNHQGIAPSGNGSIVIPW